MPQRASDAFFLDNKSCPGITQGKVADSADFVAGRVAFVSFSIESTKQFANRETIFTLARKETEA